MSKKPDEWMPLHIGDYLADTMHLATEQHGAYLLLIMAYWRKGCALPDCPTTLAGIAKMPAKAWRKAAPVLAEFFTVAEGRWTHKRIEAELSAAHELMAKRSQAGSYGAAKRWQTHSKANGKPIANAQQNDRPVPSTLVPSTKEIVNNLSIGLDAFKKPSLPPEQRRQRWQQKVVAFAQRTLAPHELRIWIAVALTDTAEGKAAFERMNDRMRAEESDAAERVSKSAPAIPPPAARQGG